MADERCFVQFPHRSERQALQAEEGEQSQDRKPGGRALLAPCPTPGSQRPFPGGKALTHGKDHRNSTVPAVFRNQPGSMP